MPQRQFRSSITTQGRRMAGARSLWRATSMKTEDFRKPIIAIANSFTQFVPGHVHLHEVGQKVKAIIDANGGYGVEFNTIAVDDGIAMGHDGYLTKSWRRDGNGWKRKARMLSSRAIVSVRSPPPCGRMRHSRPVLPAARCEM